eukprot:gene10216-2636_t
MKIKSISLDSEDEDFEIKGSEESEDEEVLNVTAENEEAEDEFIDDYSDEDFVEDVKPPKSLQERMKKLNELLSKAERYSEFLEAQSRGLDPLEKNPKKKQKIEKVTFAQPKYLSGGDLREYQLKGVEWLVGLWEQGMHGILADEMGLGKTVQSLGILAHLFGKKIKGPFLIVAPLSTLSNWMNEIKKWCPEFKVLLYHGNQSERRVIREKNFSRNDITCIVTSYEVSLRDRSYLMKFTYKYLIVDEGHRLKNFNCKLVRSLKRLKSDNRLLLTGTPLQNNLNELWSLLNFIVPDIFDDLDIFQSFFNFTDIKEQEKSKVAKEKQTLVHKLHSILRPFLFRRLKVDVDTFIPEKKEFILYIPMVKTQRELYDSFEKKEIVPKLKGKIDRQNFLTLIMQLRKVCNHSLFFKEFVYNDKLSIEENDVIRSKQIVDHSGKLKMLDKMIPILKKNGHKVLIFSLFTTMLDILEQYMNIRKINFCRLDGHVKQTDREERIKQFNEDEDKLNLERMIISKGNFKGVNAKKNDISTENLIHLLFNPDKESENEKEIISDENLVKILIKRDEEMDKKGYGYEEVKVENETLNLE